MKEQQPKKDLFYYLTLFKLKGHNTWRANLSSKKDGFDNERTSQIAGVWPEVTDKQVIKIDRVSGIISSEDEI